VRKKSREDEKGRGKEGGRDVGELAGCPRKLAVVGGGPSFSFTHNSIVDSDEFCF
jgi:hypothetical protein